MKTVNWMNTSVLVYLEFELPAAGKKNIVSCCFIKKHCFNFINFSIDMHSYETNNEIN